MRVGLMIRAVLVAAAFAGAHDAPGQAARGENAFVPASAALKAARHSGTATSEGRLGVATFNLTPREVLAENVEQTREMARGIVEVVKTLLYAQSGESAARAQGRRLWFDPNTLTLTITDTQDNLRLVSDYINSQPTIRKSPGRSEIVFLKHQESGELADTLKRVTGIAGAEPTAGQGGESVTKTLRVEGELTFRDIRIRVTRVNENDAADDNDDSVELVVRTATTSEDRTIEEFRSEFIEDYEINVIEVCPSGTPGEGSARIEIRYAPQTTPVVGGQPPAQ